VEVPDCLLLVFVSRNYSYFFLRLHIACVTYHRVKGLLHGAMKGLLDGLLLFSTRYIQSVLICFVLFGTECFERVAGLCWYCLAHCMLSVLLVCLVLEYDKNY
jgi:hypothetical protein